MNIPTTTPEIERYRYLWPSSPSDRSAWAEVDGWDYLERTMPETDDELADDTAWPAFFPAAVCLLTASDGERSVLEREVGASIVNRFPYIVAVSICRSDLSARHHARSVFMDVLERSGAATLQFLEPGDRLDRALEAIGTLPDAEADRRLERSGLETRPSATNSTPALQDAYLVYETRLVQPQRDFEGRMVCEQPWVDIGSHRVYFLEINAIGMRRDIAEGSNTIRWRSLPAWRPTAPTPAPPERTQRAIEGYSKGYTPRYAYPSSTTAAFEYDEIVEGLAYKFLAPLPEDQVEVDNDRARWPAFFPSSVGLITTWTEDGSPNLMPCGSTTVVSRHPFVISPCVSYAAINVRYAPRFTLDRIRRSGRFGCSVPFISDQLVEAMKYSGNISFATDPDKVSNSGLTLGPHSEYGPVIAESPIHYDCEVVDEIFLGTHSMFLGEVRRILVRTDVTPENPLEWYPISAVATSGAEPPV